MGLFWENNTMLKKILIRLKQDQRFWRLAAWTAKYLPLSFFNRPPKRIIVELTNSCNLRCPVCPTRTMKRPRGFMPFELFRAMIDEFKNFKEKPRLFFNFAGEPLLHPEAPEFIKYAKEHGHWTFVSTNATRLTPDLSRRLIAAGLDEINLCLDGFSAKSQESYRIGSNFEEVKRNIEEFLRLRQESGAITLRAYIQTLVTALSESELGALEAFARSAGADGIVFKSISLGDTEEAHHYDKLLPDERTWRRRQSDIEHTLCSFPLDTAVVYWDGQLGLCCLDFDDQVHLEALQTAGGLIPAFKARRSSLMRRLGFRRRAGICAHCDFGNSDFVGRTVKFD